MSSSDSSSRAVVRRPYLVGLVWLVRRARLRSEWWKQVEEEGWMGERGGGGNSGEERCGCVGVEVSRDVGGVGVVGRERERERGRRREREREKDRERKRKRERERGRGRERERESERESE